MSDLVVNPEDRFSRVTARFMVELSSVLGFGSQNSCSRNTDDAILIFFVP